jgi:hypothetical protein
LQISDPKDRVRSLNTVFITLVKLHKVSYRCYSRRGKDTDLSFDEKKQRFLSGLLYFYPPMRITIRIHWHVVLVECQSVWFSWTFLYSGVEKAEVRYVLKGQSETTMCRKQAQVESRRKATAKVSRGKTVYEMGHWHARNFLETLFGSGRGTVV